MVIPNTTFIQLTADEDLIFNADNFDGIVGLSFFSDLSIPTIFDLMITNRLVDRNIFSLYINMWGESRYDS